MIEPNATTLVTGPVIYPVTLFDVKDHLRLEYEENSVAGTTTESASVTYVDATSFTVDGDVRKTYLPGRFIQVDQSAGVAQDQTGYVKTATYSSGDDKTTIVVNEDLVIDAGISALYYGDTNLVSYVASAVEEAEIFLGRKIITQTWDVFYSKWPAGDYLQLPFGDCSTVTSLKYTDDDESQSTAASTVYGSSTDSVPGVIYLKPDQAWPTDTLWPHNPIVVRADFGYGSTIASIPEDIRSAILLLIDDLNEYRGTRITGTIVAELKTVEMLLWKHRLHVVR